MTKALIQARHLQAALVFAALALPAVARADVITSLHSDVSVSRDNVATVKETIVYDPEDSSHHGIFRYVPAQFKDEAGNTYYTRITLGSVTDEQGDNLNLANHYSDRQQLYLKIGDPHTYLSPGPHTYIITYTIAPLVLKGEGYDRFIYNVTGQGWQTDIQAATADIKFDAATSITDTKCYTGATGSAAHNCTTIRALPNVVTITARDLTVGSGLTADVQLSPGSVTNYLQPGVIPPLTTADKAALGLSALAFLLGLVALLRIFWYWFGDHHERKGRLIIAQYEPPEGLTPAQMSILESPGADVADITATLIDLAIRGFIKIEQTSPKTWWRGAHYRLNRLPGQGKIEQYEAVLLDSLFGGADTVDLQKLKYNSGRQSIIRLAIQNMRKVIGKDLKQKGYYQSSPTTSLAFARLLASVVGAVISAVVIAVIEVGFNYSWWAVLLPLVATVAGLAATFIRTDRTLLGNEEWAKVEGFKLFLSVTEKDRLDFTDAPEKTPELFGKMLPYAVALKVEKKWAKQFEGIDTARAVGSWYVGGVYLNSSAFSSDFASSFGGAVSSNFAGASGTGGVGGGGGGGGGGGW